MSKIDNPYLTFASHGKDQRKTKMQRLSVNKALLTLSNLLSFSNNTFRNRNTGQERLIRSTHKGCNAMYVEDVEDGKRTYTHILAHNFLNN